LFPLVSHERAYINQLKPKETMKKLEINNPNSYKSKATDTAMVSYHVVGNAESIAEYVRVKSAELAKVDKELSYADEDETIPLYHTTLDNACKIGEEGRLIFSVNDKGEENVYADISAYKLQRDRIDSCKDKSKKALLENRLLDKEDIFMDLLAERKSERMEEWIKKNPRVTAPVSEDFTDVSDDI
jgi:hypothetical protein